MFKKKKKIFSMLNSINPSFLTGLCLLSFFLFFFLWLELNLLLWEREEDMNSMRKNIVSGESQLVNAELA